MHTMHQPFEGFGGAMGLASLMRRPNTTIALMVVDASGSMQLHGQAPAMAVDRTINGMRASNDGRHYYVGVVSFADQPCVLQRVMPVSGIGAISGYVAAGNTRLFATVYDLLSLLIIAAREQRLPVAHDLRVVVGVFSDGDDTCSKEYAEVVKQTSEIARSQGWRLHAHGIGISGVDLASRLGFALDMSLSVERSAEGIASATQTFLSNTLAPSGTSDLPAGSGTDGLDDMQSMFGFRPRTRKPGPDEADTIPPGYAR